MNRFNSKIYLILFAFIAILCIDINAQNRPIPKKGKVLKKDRSDTSGQLLAPAQNPNPNTETDTSDIILLKHADEIEGFESESESIRFLKGNVVFYQNDAFFYCDSAYLYERQNAAHAWGRVTIIQSDTIEMFSDTLKYFGETKDAYMFGNVILKDTTQQIFTDRLDYNLDSKIAKYETGGLLRRSDAQLTSVYGTYDTRSDEAFFRDSVVVINDEFTLKADSLRYDTENRRSKFIGPTLILQDSAKIYCESGFYDYNQNKAEFGTNPQYIKDDKIALADKMTYDGATKTIFLEGNARFRENDQLAKADRMEYDEENDITRLEGNAYFKDSEKEVTADVIIHDGKDGSYTTEGKTIAVNEGNYIEANNSSYDKASDVTTLTGDVLVADSTQILTADTVHFNNTTEDAYASGDVHWQDTVNQVSIRAAELFYNKETDFVKALGRPLMTSVLDGDTLFLSADTLISETVVLDSLDTMDRILAYEDVRIFKSDFQGVCDSLFYNASDSIFQFFQTPILWSDSSQFSADTVQIVLRDESIDSVYLVNKALIVDTPDEIFFNQIKGKDIFIRFKDDKPSRMSVIGNGESIFYVQDEDEGYVGPEQIACSDMFLTFENGELQFIRFLVEPKGKLQPMKEANHNQLRLPGFKWEAKKRPLSPKDLGSPFFITKEGEIVKELK